MEALMSAFHWKWKMNRTWFKEGGLDYLIRNISKNIHAKNQKLKLTIQTSIRHRTLMWHFTIVICYKCTYLCVSDLFTCNLNHSGWSGTISGQISKKTFKSCLRSDILADFYMKLSGNVDFRESCVLRLSFHRNCAFWQIIAQIWVPAQSQVCASTILTVVS